MVNRFDITTEKKNSNRFNISDNSTLGIIKNTILGIPKAIVDVAKQDVGLFNKAIASPGSVFAKPIERAGSVIASVQQKSLTPLKESFATQKKEMFPQPEDDIKTQIDKAMILGWGFAGTAPYAKMGRPVGKIIEGTLADVKLPKVKMGTSPSSVAIVDETKAMLSKIEQSHPDISVRNRANGALNELNKIPQGEAFGIAKTMSQVFQKELAEIQPPISTTPTQIKMFNEAPQEKPLTITHYTDPKNIESILNQGFDTTKAPIHGVGGLEAGPKTAKAADDVLYFTTDNGRWNTAQVYVGEGKGTISRDVYNYEKQQWEKELNAYKKVDLSPIEAEVRPDAKILIVDGYNQALTIIQKMGNQLDPFNMIKQLVDTGKQAGFDIVNIKNPGGTSWEIPGGRTTKYGDKNWYKTLTGNSGNSDYFVLNKDVLNIKGAKQAPKKIDVSGTYPKVSAKGSPGFQKFSRGLDNLVTTKTILPEDATILKTIFEGTNDDYLGLLNIEANGRLTGRGRFSIKENRFTENVIPETNRLQIQKGLFLKGTQSADAAPVKVFSHEFGHSGYHLILNQEERDIVDSVFHSVGKQGAIRMFEGGLSNKAEGGQAKYYAKNSQEFLAETFAEYVLENKVPAETMRPLLQKLLTKFWEGLKRLVNRAENMAVNRMKPLFEKILAGDKNTPLSEFMEKEPISFKQELKKMMDTMPQPVKATKEVPVASLMPKIETINPQVQQPAPPSTLTEQINQARAEQEIIQKSNTQAPLPEEFPAQAAEMRTLIKNSPILDNIPNYKDITNLQKGFKDPFRVIQQVFAKDYPIIENGLIRPFDNAKGNFINFQKTELADYKQAIDTKFKEGSSEDMAIRLYGENKKSLDDLTKAFGPEKTAQIVEAEKWFRNKYDTYLEALNKVEQQIYPNSPWKWTPKRQDYFRHGWELGNSFSRLQNILDNPVQIDPLLSGISEKTQPKSRWASFKQRRLTDDTKLGAMRGYLDYLPSVSYATNIDQFIGKFRELGDILRRGQAQAGTKNLNNFTDFLESFSNQLANKTNDVDRVIVKYFPGGRTTLEVATLINNRIKANTVVGNISSSISQISNVPQGIASAGKINSAKALAKTLAQNFVPNELMKKSTFLPERYFKGYEEFDKKFLDNPKKLGVWMLTVLDEAGTKFIWNGQAEKAMELGITDPIEIARYSDVQTRKLVGGRGIGEKSLMQNSKLFQILAPFQLEVTNFWYVLKDLYKDNPKMLSKLDKILTLFVIIWLFNNQTEKMTGNRLIFDPIDATTDGIGFIQDEPNIKGLVKGTGRLAGELLGNIPFGQTIAAQYPEFGIKSVGLPTRRALFGDEDPTRFGTGLTISKGFLDPLYKIVPPLGGAQIKKTITGISTWLKGKKTNTEGDFQYKIDQTPVNLIKAGIFGPQGLPQTQAYYEKKNAPKTTTNRFNMI